MVQRTLTALFSLAVLILPASQLYADDNVYSGVECKYIDSFADEGQMMVGGDVSYHPVYGMGNLAPDDRGGTPLASDYAMGVICPLPPLDIERDMVVVSVIDSTRNDDVACEIKACTPGIGGGETGTSGGLGQCESGGLKSTRYSNNGTDGYANTASGPDYILPIPGTPATPTMAAVPGIPSPNPGAGLGADHVTQNADLLTFNRLNDNNRLNDTIPEPPDVGTGALRHPFVSLHPTPNVAGPMPGLTVYLLECTIPERATAHVNSTTQGISYVQSYSVLPIQ
jgi:hypothetical protein